MPNLDFIVDFFDFIIDFFQNGIYQFFVDLTAYLLKKGFIALIEFKLWLLTFAWDVARSIIQSYQIPEQINAAFANLTNSDLFVMLRFPDCINILLNARLTRFVFKYLS